MTLIHPRENFTTKKKKKNGMDDLVLEMLLRTFTQKLFVGLTRNRFDFKLFVKRYQNL